MRKLFNLLNLLIIVGWIGVTLASSADGLSYLRQKQTGDGTIGGLANTAWAVMALSAQGESNSSAIAALQRVQTTLASRSATDIEKQILALVAAGENPREFAGVDAVSALVKTISNNQFGDTNLINDDIFGLLALKAANEPVSVRIIEQLISNQNEDGGWGIDIAGGSSTDMTAVALLALKGVSVEQSVIDRGVKYIRARQNSDGGFATISGSSNLASTIWVNWMINGLGYAQNDWSQNGKSSQDYINNSQRANGSWQDSVLLTSYALIPTLPLIRKLATSPTPTPSVVVMPTPTATALPTLAPTNVLPVSPKPATTLLSPSPVTSDNRKTLSSSKPTALPKPTFTPGFPSSSPSATPSSNPATVTPNPTATGSFGRIPQTAFSPNSTILRLPVVQPITSPTKMTTLPQAISALTPSPSPSFSFTPSSNVFAWPKDDYESQIVFGIGLLVFNVLSTAYEMLQSYTKRFS